MPSRRQVLATRGAGVTGALAGCGGVTGSAVETVDQTATFVADDGDEEDSFGESVALSASPVGPDACPGSPALAPCSSVSGRSLPR